MKIIKVVANYPTVEIDGEKLSIDEVVTRLRSLQAANEEKTMSLHDYAEYVALTNHVENQRKELYHLNKVLAAERQEKEKLKDEYEMTKKKLISCQSKISELQLGIGNAKEYTEFNKLKKDNAILQKNVEDLNEEIKVLNCMLSKLKDDNKDVKRASAHGNISAGAVILEYTEYAKLKDDNARLQQNVEDLNEEIEALNCMLSKKDGEIENVKRAHNQDNTTRDAVILRISRRYNASRVILNRVLSNLRRSEQEILKFNPNDFNEKEDP